ncbi:MULTISPECIES: ion channel [Mameliella]|uniref:ion channel n=1 Tax=Mameliella TaxID=1434019 RepID=UPI000B52E8B2|nr:MULTISPECIES: ion channel [Mameliella]OWV40293.1 metal transporter [Mameliella alba]OWV58845.1 metal transporter [Mameliella alba]
MSLLLALVIGTVGNIGYGVVHHFALTAAIRLLPHQCEFAHRRAITTFSTLLVLHVAEIVALAALNLLLLEHVYREALGDAQAGFEQALYMTGLAFSTLGFGEIDAKGPFRIILMLQSLLGFMLLTWSATFIYSACQKSWRRAETRQWSDDN